MPIAPHPPADAGPFLSPPCGERVWVRGIASAIVSLALCSAAASANDSTAELGTGGLDFVQNENVEMRSEQLFVSTEQVRVTYHFFNKSEQPVTNLVAFPLPDITIADQDTNISVPT